MSTAPNLSLRTEAIAGITTFFTMSYIVVVNPTILSTPGTGMAFSGVLTATVLICFSMTLLMGLYAKLPFAVAPGMGINAFFTFTIILTQKVWWQVALGIVFWAGVLFLLISVTPVRETIAKAIPSELRIGTAAGIGVFLTFIGLKNAGFIAADPVTFVKLGVLGKPCGLGATCRAAPPSIDSPDTAIIPPILSCRASQGESASGAGRYLPWDP